jgi:hypothetical protein
LKKPAIRKLICESIVARALLTVHRKKIKSSAFNILPISLSKKLALGLCEKGLQLDGYRIVRIKDVSKAEDIGQFYNDILWKAGLLTNIDIPQVRVKNWKTVFTDLQQLGKIIVVETVCIDCKYPTHAIGRVTRVGKKKIKFEYFDANGKRQEQVLRIPYKFVTSVAFGGRFEEIISKYLV